jgi:hypothetical protein
MERRFAAANRPETGEEEEEAIVNEALRLTRPTMGQPVENCS